MKYTKYIIVAFIIVVLLVIGLMLKGPADSVSQQNQTTPIQHLYVSWDTMEFDKCVSAWLIVRFIDKDAKFVFYPQGTEITEGTVFDVPGAQWSRKHRKCTSQCILEEIDVNDPAVRQIIDIAGKVELNFWQLDRWPLAQKCFYEVKEITDQTSDPLECFKKSRPYFDKLYKNFKRGDADDDNI